MASHGSHGGTVVDGHCDWAEATTLWDDGMTAGSQWTTTGTLTQTSTGTCLQIVLGTQTVLISVTCFCTVTGHMIVLGSTTWWQMVYGHLAHALDRLHLADGRAARS